MALTISSTLTVGDYVNAMLVTDVAGSWKRALHVGRVTRVLSESQIEARWISPEGDFVMPISMTSEADVHFVARG